MSRPGNAPVPLVHPSALGRSGAPAGARLAGSAIERLVWALPRPGTSLLPIFTLRYLLDLTSRPECGWLVQELSGRWSGPCPGRGTPPPLAPPYPSSPGDLTTRPGRDHQQPGRGAVAG